MKSLLFLMLYSLGVFANSQFADIKLTTICKNFHISSISKNEVMKNLDCLELGKQLRNLNDDITSFDNIEALSNILATSTYYTDKDRNTVDNMVLRYITKEFSSLYPTQDIVFVNKELSQNKLTLFFGVVKEPELSIKIIQKPYQIDNNFSFSNDKLTLNKDTSFDLTTDSNRLKEVYKILFSDMKFVSNEVHIDNKAVTKLNDNKTIILKVKDIDIRVYDVNSNKVIGWATENRVVKLIKKLPPQTIKNLSVPFGLVEVVYENKYENKQIIGRISLAKELYESNSVLEEER